MTYPIISPSKKSTLYPIMYPSTKKESEEIDVPLWESAPTSVTVGGKIFYGRAFEIPELNRVIHTVEATGLTPDRVYPFNLPEGNITTIYTTLKGDPRSSVVIHWQEETPFKVKSKTTYQRKSYKFRTFPQSLDDRNLTMLSGGDIFQQGQVAKMKSVFDVVFQRNPDLFVICGDIAYANNVWSNRTQWHTLWAEWMARVDSETPLIPIVAGIGNHEVGNGTTITEWHGERFNFDTKTLGQNTWFAAQFAFPANGSHGVIDVGDYLSIVMLDTEHASPELTGSDAQSVWLQNVLDARKGIKHVIPFTHVPGYPASRSYNQQRSKRVRENWHPIFESHGRIKVVFEHHDHVYKRTVPILHVDGVPTEHPGGIVYLGDGALGVAIRDGWNPNTTWYLEDSKAAIYVRAESGTPDPRDGQPGYDTTVNEAWHIYETVFENDKRTITTLNALGNGLGEPYHVFEQDVSPVEPPIEPDEPNTYYDNGNELIAVTGGWVEGYKALTTTQSKNTNSLYSYSKNGRCTWITDNMVDITEISKLYIDYSSVMVGGSAIANIIFGITADKNASSGSHYLRSVSSNGTDNNKILAIDISDLSGSYYIGVRNFTGSGGENTINIHKIWGEK